MIATSTTILSHKMTAKKILLKPGVTVEDLIDDFETYVVSYMMKRRGLDEAGMRKLIHSDLEVAASYKRKIDRMIAGAIAEGMPASTFGRAA